MALEKLKSGDFVSSYKWGDVYEITVKMSYSESNREFRDEVKSVLAKRHIPLLIYKVIEMDIVSNERAR